MRLNSRGPDDLPGRRPRRRLQPDGQPARTRCDLSTVAISTERLPHADSVREPGDLVGGSCGCCGLLDLPLLLLRVLLLRLVLAVHCRANLVDRCCHLLRRRGGLSLGHWYFYQIISSSPRIEREMFLDWLPLAAVPPIAPIDWFDIVGTGDGAGCAGVA